MKSNEEHGHLFADQPTCHEGRREIRVAAEAAKSVVIHGLIVKENEREMTIVGENTFTPWNE